MPLGNGKSNEVDEALLAGELSDTHLVVRSPREFASLLQQDLANPAIFYPTRKKLVPGTDVTVSVRLGRRQPPLVLYGKVAWRRSGKHLEKVRAGLGIEFLADEQPKIEYLTDLVQAGGSVKSRRRHERVPVDLPISWRPLGASEGGRGRLRDVGRGGAFVRTDHPAPGDEQVVIEIAPPGAEIPMAFAARVAWSGRQGEAVGFGVEWRARDAGGSRRIRELVRRLTVAP